MTTASLLHPTYFSHDHYLSIHLFLYSCFLPANLYLCSYYVHTNQSSCIPLTFVVNNVPAVLYLDTLRDLSESRVTFINTCIHILYVVFLLLSACFLPACRSNIEFLLLSGKQGRELTAIQESDYDAS